MFKAGEIPRPRPLPTVRLAALIAADRLAARRAWTAIHARAIRHLAAAELVLAEAAGDEGLFAVAAALAGPAYGWLDQADAALGCDCRARVA